MKKLLFITFLSFFTACTSKHACKNTDPIFDQYGPTDQQYKQELLTQLQHTNPSGIHYIVDKYTEQQGKPFISISVYADSFCAEMSIDIKNPNKLAHFKTVKGISYTGAEITGLRFKTDTINGVYNFVFEEGMINGKKQ